MDFLYNARPLLSQKITQGDESNHPHEAAAIREQCENVRLELGAARNDSRKVANARHEVAEEQCPPSHALEPVVDAVESRFSQMQITAVFVNQIEAASAPDYIADGDAASAAG